MIQIPASPYSDKSVRSRGYQRRRVGLNSEVICERCGAHIVVPAGDSTFDAAQEHDEQCFAQPEAQR